MKALIVDDSNINIKAAAAQLKKLSVISESAFSGEECLELVKNNSYDVIFMDIMMPGGMDGVQTYHELQKIEGFNVPVVVLTADVSDNAEARYLAEGFYDYIPKPIDIVKLGSVISKIEGK